jgi:heme exporter protein B
MQRAPTTTAAGLVFRRDLTLAWRRWDEVAQPLIFYVVVTTLFPLATTPDLAQLRVISGGVVWVAALLASLLALESLFRSDVEDGTMEQWVLSGQPLGWLLLAKVASHWVLTGLVLPLAMPLLIFGSRAVGMAMDGDSPAGPLQLLAAIFFLTLSLGPLAMSAAIRISVES